MGLFLIVPYSVPRLLALLFGIFLADCEFSFRSLACQLPNAGVTW